MTHQHWIFCDFERAKDCRLYRCQRGYALEHTVMLVSLRAYAAITDECMNMFAKMK